MKKEVKLAFYLSLIFVFSFAVILTWIPLINNQNVNIYIIIIELLSFYLFSTLYQYPGYADTQISEAANEHLTINIDNKIKKKQKVHTPYQRSSKTKRLLEDDGYFSEPNEFNGKLFESPEKNLKQNKKYTETSKSSFSHSSHNAGSSNEDESSFEIHESLMKLTKFPLKHYCSKCEIEQEYRVKHCNRCQKCICKFDHHCFWIGKL